MMGHQPVVRRWSSVACQDFRGSGFGSDFDRMPEVLCEVDQALKKVIDRVAVLYLHSTKLTVPSPHMRRPL